MLQMVTAGKQTSDRGSVVEWIVVTTVDLVKSSEALQIKRDATPIDAWGRLNKKINLFTNLIYFVFSNVHNYYIVFLSDDNEKGTNMNNRTMEYGWHQSKDYVGGAT